MIKPAVRYRSLSHASGEIISKMVSPQSLNYLPKPIYWSIFTIALALILTACATPGANSTPTPDIQHEQWITDWLDHPACQPPCWQNITVGSTTITETASLLGNLTGVVISGPSKNATGNGSTLWWEFPGSGSTGGAFTDENGAVIVKLLLSMDPSQMLRADEVLQVYGPPAYLMVRGCAGTGSQAFCTVHLIYEQGMALELFVLAGPGTVDVTPDSPVNRIWFFPPGIQAYEAEIGMDQLNVHSFLVEWVGYSEYTYP